ncbi:MAG: RidA family protein [Thermofilaceae archaeon]|nr:RidA family protein [Thermofilaceae archaeon]MCX8180791.1 RidA family protein [Thermofilaceae archaeon]
MLKEIVFTERAPKPIGPYSQAVKVGDFIFVSGQIGINPITGKLVEGGVREQARQALENIKAILEEAGSSIEDVVLAVVFITDMAFYRDLNDVYIQYFKTPPVRAVVGVKELPAGALVEILVVAVKHRFS